MEWSYDLLSPGQRSLFAQLAVFRGGWDLEAAEAICLLDFAEEAWASEEREEPSVLDLLAQLQQQSLVLLESGEERARYRLLEPLRQFAAEKLEENRAGDALRQRYIDYFLAWTQQANAHLSGEEQREWHTRIETEHNNLRHVLTLCRQHPEWVKTGMLLAATLSRFWWTRGYLHEGRQHLSALLSHPSGQAPTAARSQALNAAGSLARMQSDYEQARRHLQESLAIKEQLGDPRGRAASLCNLGNVLRELGAADEAKPLFEEALAISLELQDVHAESVLILCLGNVEVTLGHYEEARTFYRRSLVLSQSQGDLARSALVQCNLGFIAYRLNEYPLAHSLFESALTHCREVGDRVIETLCLQNLAAVLCHQEEYVASHAAYRECLTLCRELGNRRTAIQALEGVAQWAQRRRQPEKAVALYAAAGILRGSIRLPLPPADQPERGVVLAESTACLGARAFATAFTAGEMMNYDQTILYALA